MSRLRRRNPRRLSVRLFSFGEKNRARAIDIGFFLLLPFHILSNIRQRLLHGLIFWFCFFFFFFLKAFGYSNVYLSLPAV